MNPLEVFQDGFVGRGQPLRNGGAVPLGGDVRAEIFIDPYPATGGTSWLDLYLASNGQPIKNAAVVTDSEMLYMRHGALHQDGRTLGDGHYVFPLNYPMVGVWRHRLSISLAQEHYILPLAVTVFPS